MSQQEPHAGSFKALADPTRRAILRLLRKGEMMAGDIAANFAMAAPSVSHHLSVLTGAGLLRVRREGSKLFYSLDLTVMQELTALILDLTPPSRPTDEK
ncbi:MAG: autorepressor SdpR family transcription factor [Armatimonadota bacterium]